MTANFASDLSGRATALPHFWEHTVGSGHATLALRADWQAQLKQAHDDLGMQHVRFHGILDDDIGTLVSEGGTLFYSFFNADQIFDFLLSIGMKPFVELSFMPSALSSGDQTIFHYRANVSPPMPPPSSSRQSSKRTGWFRDTAIGRFRIFSRKTISLQCHSKAALGC